MIGSRVFRPCSAIITARLDTSAQAPIETLDELGNRCSAGAPENDRAAVVVRGRSSAAPSKRWRGAASGLVWGIGYHSGAAVVGNAQHVLHTRKGLGGGMHHPGRCIPVDLRCVVVLIVISWTNVAVAHRRRAPPHAAFPGAQSSVRAGVDPHARQLDVA